MTDIRAGLAAGIHVLLVLSGLGVEQFREHHHEVNGPFRICMNLKHATEVVLKGLHIPSEVQTSLERACYSFLDLAEQLDSLTLLEEQGRLETSLTL
jgi:hypothetical protein